MSTLKETAVKVIKKDLIDFISLCLLLLMIFIAGIKIGQKNTCQQQHANDLLKVGFTIIDPEGHEIRKFDE